MKLAHKQNTDLQFLSSEDGFLGLTGDDAFTPEKAKAWVIPFGLEASVSYGGGTASGPQAIIEASHQVELFDEVFWAEAFRGYGVATLDNVPHPKKVSEALNVLESTVQNVLDQKKFPLIFGGEHSLTAGSIRPFAKAHKQITILQFDAHADLRDGYDGEHYSHAAAMRRCLDHDNVRLVSVGIRNISAGEIPFLESNKDRIEIFWAKDKAKWNAQQIAKTVGNGPVYLTFDLDGFDSSLMQATGTPEPGGLFWDEVMEIIATVSKKASIVGADIVELAPAEGFHACDFLAAKLAYKILSY
ncbi:MAG TPA: agmatinase, partial [Rhodospirillaceae bacterium]|nr:agmatinase [Rhodospirillaceae bacterium]